MIRVPGQLAEHVFITDECREVHGGDGAAIEEALSRVRTQLVRCMKGHPKGAGHRFHVLASVVRGGDGKKVRRTP